MKKAYFILRIAAYIAGLGGMILFVTARQRGAPQSAQAVAGGILLIGSFICFMGTYVIYMALRLQKR